VRASAVLIEGRVASATLAFDGSDLPTTVAAARFAGITNDGATPAIDLAGANLADPISPASLAGTSVGTEWAFHDDGPSGPSVTMGTSLPEFSATQSAAAEPAKFAALGGAAATLLRRHRRRIC
jgi:hypothetical protein